MIVKYFSSLDELVSNVCREMRGWRRLYGAVHVVRVFGVKRYDNGDGELVDWDLEVVPYCSKVRDRLLLKVGKPILAFVRVGNRGCKVVVFYVYFNSQFFSRNEIEEIINEFNEYIKSYWFALKIRSG
jgi:hypothetical protein